MVAYFNISVSPSDIGSSCADAGDLFAELINRIGEGCADGVPPSRWLRDFVEELDSDGRALIKHLAAAITADEKSEGGA